MELKTESKTDIKNLCKELERRGFTCFSMEDKMISSKLDVMVRHGNVIGLNVDTGDIIRKFNLNKIDSFTEIKQVIDTYFSQFTVEDKITELLGKVSLVSHEGRVPSKHYPSPFEIQKYKDLQKKWGFTEPPLDADGVPAQYFRIYDLRPGKKILKVCSSSKYNIAQLLEKLYADKRELLPETKEFANGNVDIIGNIEPLRSAYIKYYSNRRHNRHSMIIIEK